MITLDIMVSIPPVIGNSKVPKVRDKLLPLEVITLVLFKKLFIKGGFGARDKGDREFFFFRGTGKVSFSNAFLLIAGSEVVAIFRSFDDVCMVGGVVVAVLWYY